MHRAGEGCHGRDKKNSRVRAAATLRMGFPLTGIRRCCLNFNETGQMPRGCLGQDFDRLFCWWESSASLVDREIAVGCLGQKGRKKSKLVVGVSDLRP